MSDTSSVSTHNTSFSILKGVKFIFISYLISIILIAILSAVITYTDVPENIMAPSVRVITFFQAFLSSLLTTRSVGSKGWLAGMINGILNIAVLILLGMAILGAGPFTVSNAYMLLFGAISGMAGGIIGVNLTA